ncbi:sigma 54-interacting transcriptional regulator [Thalassospira sp.]|uniref:sigma-54-dependent transcriptional regulator n=1 Tax=Thalassospira sp. TaxID=1912094 RepID=UPI001AFE04B9|nr:sigma 54-interacting transcriptional regulator [Thalassospira sp.]MBO6806235.1 sigma 54-interacting transcriptional regulator [Thalassospira sp.]MBO6839243.1 sigma 54-interacting transcriptional regulator [Thalassospira sp.]
MRFEIRGENRLGITRDVINVLTDQGLDIRAFEVTTHHIYADIPAVRPERFPALAKALKQIPGIFDITEIDRLPTERRRAQLHATLAALGDPVIAVDASGLIAQANPAAQAISATPDMPLRDQDISSILAEPSIEDLRQGGFHLPEREVALGGQTYLLQVEPIGHVDDGSDCADDAPWGGVMVFHRPARLGRVITALQDRSHTGFGDIIGTSRAMLRVKSQAERLAAIDAPLLILGETGTGKELFARACHRASTRADQPFLALNCAALPEGLAESELFGYAAGAFTSARRGGKPGLLELADGGTLFLDEIGELTPYLQAKLLRVLQDGSFRRVGGTDEITVDVRIISATNRDLEAMSHDGTFREDLYFRLNVLGITLPPLRDRVEDIADLAAFFIDRTAQQTERSTPRLARDGLDWLCAHDWPGNVRELENTLFRAVALLDGNTLSARDLADAASGTASTLAPQTHNTAETAQDTATPPTQQTDLIATALAQSDFNSGMDLLEREMLARLYPDYPSSRKLADRLGVSHTSIANKLRKYGIGT